MRATTLHDGAPEQSGRRRGGEQRGDAPPASDPARPWAAELAAHITTTGGAAAVALPAAFDAERYRAAVLKRFDKLNFEMLDTTGVFYSAVRLWSVFVPQSVRECHQYNPRLLEIPKEHQRRLPGLERS